MPIREDIPFRQLTYAGVDSHLDSVRNFVVRSPNARAKLERSLSRGARKQMVAEM